MIPRPGPAGRQPGRPRYKEHERPIGTPQEGAADTVAFGAVSASAGHRVAHGVG